VACFLFFNLTCNFLDEKTSFMSSSQTIMFALTNFKLEPLFKKHLFQEGMIVFQSVMIHLLTVLLASLRPLHLPLRENIKVLVAVNL